MSYLLDINIKYLNIYIKVLFTQFQGFVFTSLCPPTSETKPNIHPWACAWIMQQSIQQSIKGKSYCTFVSLTWIQYGDALGRGTGVNGLTIHPRSHGLLSLFQHPVLHHSWNQSKKGVKGLCDSAQWNRCWLQILIYREREQNLHPKPFCQWCTQCLCLCCE